MKVLIVGRGGREHSVAQHVAKSDLVSTVFVAPGNSGMEDVATCVPIEEMEIETLLQFAKENDVELTIVGPENPLNAGIADAFQEAGLKVFAPSQKAALLEGSKAFAKDFMVKYNIPTADYATFTEPEAARQYIEEKGAPIVIKADGLAEGKGVIVAMTQADALEAIDHLMVNKAFSEAGSTIVVEEFLEGREYSLIAFVHENNVYPMIPARDHKRAFDNDQGPNTGGMGVFAPVPDITADIIEKATKDVLQQAADGLMEEGRPFTGILYAGLMETKNGTKVIEFNTRFGDPETQVVLPLLENDLVQVFLDVLAGKDPQLVWKDASCVGVVVASKGYPGQYEKGIVLPKLQARDDNAFIVHAGTKKEGDGFVSNGGRVLLYGAIAEDIDAARDVVYKELDVFDANDDYFYRTDIGK
ncbi:MAG TPA: phosphoribosylamine--glycine ligase [Pseudogracilibacillus sp.]|nr:phosphoribosylamine--glycine ligase [Pseudogracilibacillus sp.]